jgi:aryl-alcohol dehydrogenase-like predicted oxidoreductase
MSPATLGIAWIASNPVITAPIIGGRNCDQLKDSLAAADIVLDAELRTQATKLFAEPSPVTDRSEETVEGFSLRD